MTCPVRCDYCTTVDVVGRQNCASCGGPLPIPEVVEHVIEREYRLNRDMFDATSFGDTHRVFVAGPLDARLSERVHRVERTARRRAV